MRGFVVSSLIVLPLLAGCAPDEPLVPELKGRWAAPNATKLRYALLADRMQHQVPVQTSKHATDCSEQYVTFEKRRGISLYMDGKINTLFVVREVKRERSRLILAGQAPLTADGQGAKLELVLRDREVRFDDIVDERGRSIRYERFENEQARRVGITTIGDIFRLVLDLKACWT